MFDQSTYDSQVLPEGWEWEAVICFPNGYNGHFCMANVASDKSCQLWVFTKSGRYRVDRWHLEKYKVAGHPLAGLPLELDPLKVKPRRPSAQLSSPSGTP